MKGRKLVTQKYLLIDDENVTRNERIKKERIKIYFQKFKNPEDDKGKVKNSNKLKK